MTPEKKTEITAEFKKEEFTDVYFKDGTKDGGGYCQLKLTLGSIQHIPYEVVENVPISILATTAKHDMLQQMAAKLMEQAEKWGVSISMGMNPPLQETK